MVHPEGPPRRSSGSCQPVMWVKGLGFASVSLKGDIIHSFIQQKLIEHLLYPRHCTRHWEDREGQIKIPHSTNVLMEDTGKKPVNMQINSEMRALGATKKINRIIGSNYSL